MEYFSRGIALILLFLLTPLIILISVFCYFFQGRPLFFRQIRIGYKYKPFNIIKFKTMIENSGSEITSFGDKRITKFGRILRATKFDEIPQLINIIKGEMRFIGPRPEVETYFNKDTFSFLKNIKPGISDISSILLRNEDKILSSIGGVNPYDKLLPIKLILADYYSRNKSFIFDLKLVFITIISIFFPKISNYFLYNIIQKDELEEVMKFIRMHI